MNKRLLNYWFSDESMEVAQAVLICNYCGAMVPERHLTDHIGAHDGTRPFSIYPEYDGVIDGND